MNPLVIALGGNALLQKGEVPTFHNQVINAVKAARGIAGVLSEEKGFAITHGNGPQVGEELLRSEYAKALPGMPLHVLVAETQAIIGSMLELALVGEFAKLGAKKKVCTIITHVAVDEKDPAFKKLSKPIGPFYTKEQLEKELQLGRFDYVPIGKEYRRVVASPEPVGILEMEQIKYLISRNYIVICCGGGGIPVHNVGGGFRGTDAVIDKDLTTQLLATSLGAEEMAILTDVDYSYKSSAMKEPIRSASAGSMKMILDNFESGSWRPKISACIKFIENGGKKAYIGNLYKLDEVLKGESGTIIH